MQTQLEHLSDASFLGRLLVLPANVRLDRKKIAKYKHSSLFGLIDSDEGKKFYNIDVRIHLIGRLSSRENVDISSSSNFDREILFVHQPLGQRTGKA